MRKATLQLLGLIKNIELMALAVPDVGMKAVSPIVVWFSAIIQILDIMLGQGRHSFWSHEDSPK